MADVVTHKRWVTLADGITKPPPGHGALLGKQWEARYCAQAAYEAGFVDALELLTIVCIGGAESQLYDHAIHVNEDLTEDRGWLQLSSTHTWITDDIAYDIWEAAKAARKLVVAKQRAGGEGFEDWVAFWKLAGGIPIYQHDTYLAKAGRGVGNYLIDVLLNAPVPNIETEYQHRLTTPVLNFEHRVAGALHWFGVAKQALGFGAKPAILVQQVQEDLSHGQAAAKQSLPN
jgi:hypothetical protein